MVDGKAGKFDFIPFMITLGSGLALLSLPTLVADFFLLYFTSNKELYREIKLLDISDEGGIRVNLTSAIF